MDGYVVQGSIGMPRGSVLRIEDGRDVIVHAWEGHLWITQSGDTRDYFIAPGESFTLDREGVALIHAMRRAVATLTAPMPALYARSVTLVTGGAQASRVLYESARERLSLGTRLRLRAARWWTGLFAPRANPTTAAL
jgi:hypothetical protein